MGSKPLQYKKTLGLTIGILVFMIGVVAASPTLYRIFCEITGYGGTTQLDEAAQLYSDNENVAKINRITGKTTSEFGNMTLRFDANLNGGLNWDFAPQQVTMQVPIGETALAYYRAENKSSGDSIAQAVYNVTPHAAGPYFVKIDCFCFTEQTLAQGEIRDMPIDFYVDPAILEDEDLKGIQEITLSYTFFSLFDEAMPEIEHGDAHGTESKNDGKNNDMAHN